MEKEDLEANQDWNPMRDQFTDPKINAYRSMDLHQQPGFKAQKKMETPTTNDSISKELVEAQTQESFELHIMNVPLNMKEDGIHNSFRKYGRILKCFIAKPKPDSQVEYLSNF